MTSYRKKRPVIAKFWTLKKGCAIVNTSKILQYFVKNFKEVSWYVERHRVFCSFVIKACHVVRLHGGFINYDAEFSVKRLFCKHMIIGVCAQSK